MKNKLIAYQRACLVFFRRAIIALFYLLTFYFLLSLPHIWGFFIQEKTLNVYTFSEFFTDEAIRKFEEESGIKVYVRYFESNDELWAKFKINQGEGYDVITPSDFMVENLRREGLLHNLDQSKLPCISELDPKLLHKFYDSQNQFSLPLQWSIYGLVYDKSLIHAETKDYSLELIFKNPTELEIAKKPYKICMIDDGRESVMLASIYLFDKVKNITDDEYDKIFNLLVSQKKWIECYTSYGLQYMLFANIVPMALTPSSYMRKMMRLTDRFDFKFPKEGTILNIENLAIPAKSTKVDMAYKFINFMLSRKISSINSDAFGHMPANKNSYNDLEESIRTNPNFLLSDELFKKAYLVNNELPMKKIEKIWLGVKFAN